MARSRAGVRLVSSATASGRDPPSRLGVGHDQIGEQLAHAQEVLLGQHLGGRHERPLVAALDRHQQGAHSATTVLPDPTSPCSRRCMGSGPARSAPISSTARRWAPVRGNGSWPTKAATSAGRPGAGRHDVADAPGVALEHLAAHDHLELQAQELVERQPPPGPLLLGERLRRVDGAEGRGPVHELELDAPRSGQRVVERARPAQRLLHPLAELPAGDARLLRRRVDGHDPPRPVPDQVDDGVGELALAPVGVELAEEQGLGAHRQLARPPRLVEERHPQRAGAVVDVELDQGPALAGAAGPHRRRRVASTRDSSPMRMPATSACRVRSM